MALTVTAAQSGADAHNGMGLTVRVLTGAASVQNGATATSVTVTTPQLAITPSATGSLVYGAVTTYETSPVTYTPLASSTFLLNATDSTNDGAYGTFRSAPTTSGTPVTLGSSAPTGIASRDCDIALAEILAAPGANLAEDVSSPATLSTTTAETLTTASFTPPGGSMLVVMIPTSATGSATMTMTVSDSLGLTWTQLARAGASGDAYAGVWIAWVPPPAILLPLAPLIPPGLFTPMAFQSAPPPQPPVPFIAASSDAGSGTDSGSVTAAVSDTDSGSGADTGSETPGASDTDSGTGTDTGSITEVAVSDSDTGTGADIATVTAPVSASDTGSAAESGGQLAKSADTGSAAESATAGPYIAPYRPTSVLWSAPDKLSKSGGTMP